MKSYFFPSLLLFFLLISCSENESEYKAEDQLYTCLVEKAASENIDLPHKLERLEAQLIKHGTLSNASGQAKIDFYENVKNTGLVSSLPDDLSPDKSLYPIMVGFAQSDCYKQIDSELLEASKFLQLDRQVDTIVKKYGAITPSIAAEAFLSVMNAEDFEHPFYRATFLMAINQMLDRETEYERQIKERSRAQDSLFGVEGATTISTDSTGIFRINEAPTAMNQLEAKIYPYVVDLDKSDNNHIRIRITRDTKYSDYVVLQNAVQAAHQRHLNTMSKEKYNAPHSTLTAEEQAVLKDKYPLKIIEVLP